MAKKSESSAGEALWAYWKPKGVVNKKREKAFKSWLKKNAGGTDIATFIHSRTYDKSHGKALAALNRRK